MSDIQAERIRYRARKMLEASRYRDAIVELDELVNLSDHPADYAWRAQTLVALGRYEEALTDCEHAMRREFTNPSVFFTAAFIRAAAPDDLIRNGTVALELLARAKPLINGPLNWRMLSVFAAAHAECGNFVQAEKLATKSLAEAPPEFAERFRNRIQQYRDGIAFRATVESTVLSLDYRETTCTICGEPAFMRWPPGASNREPRCVDCCSHKTSETAE